MRTASRGAALVLFAIVTYVSLKENMGPVLIDDEARSEVAVAQALSRKSTALASDIGVKC